MLLAVRASNAEAIKWLAKNAGADVIICDLEDKDGGSVLHAAARNNRAQSVYTVLWGVYTAGGWDGFRGTRAHGSPDSMEAIVKKLDTSKRSFLHLLAEHGSPTDVDFILSLFKVTLDPDDARAWHEYFVDTSDFSLWHGMTAETPSQGDPLADNGSRAVPIFDWLDDQGRSARDVAAALGRDDVVRLFEEQAVEFRMATLLYTIRHIHGSDTTPMRLQMLQDLCSVYEWDSGTCLAIAKQTPWVSPEIVFDYVDRTIGSKYSLPNGRVVVDVLKWLAANWGLDCSPLVRAMSTYCPKQRSGYHDESCIDVETNLLWRIVHSDPFDKSDPFRKRLATVAPEQAACLFKTYQDQACRYWMYNASNPAWTATQALTYFWQRVHEDVSAKRTASNETKSTEESSLDWSGLRKRLEALAAEWFAEESNRNGPQKETHGTLDVEKAGNECLLHFDAEKVVLQHLMNDCGYPPPILADVVRWERWRLLIFFAEEGHFDLQTKCAGGPHSALHDFVTTSHSLFGGWPCWGSENATTANVLAWHAALGGHTFILAWLLEQGTIAPAQRGDGDDLTVLHLAAAAGHCDTVFWLIHAGKFDQQLVTPGGLNICHITAQQGTNLLFLQTLLGRWEVAPLDARGRHVWSYALETRSPEFMSWAEEDRADKAALAAMQELGRLTFAHTFGSREDHIEALTRCINVSECFSEEVIKRIPDEFHQFPPQRHVQPPDDTAPVVGHAFYVSTPLLHAWAYDSIGQPRHVYDIVQEFLRLGYTEMALRMYTEFVAKALEWSQERDRDVLFQLVLQDLAATAAGSGQAEIAAHFQALFDAKTTSKGNTDAKCQVLNNANLKLAIAFREGADVESVAAAWADCLSANLQIAQSGSNDHALPNKDSFKYPHCLVTSDGKLFHVGDHSKGGYDDLKTKGSDNWMWHHFYNSRGNQPPHATRISPLSYLAQQGFLNIIQWVLDTGKVSNSAQMYHAIEHGARAGNTAVVETLLGHGRCLDTGLDHSNRVLVALTAAVYERKFTTVKFLLRHLSSRGVDLNTIVDRSLNGCDRLGWYTMSTSTSVAHTAAVAAHTTHDLLLRPRSDRVKIDQVEDGVLEEMATKAMRGYEESVRLFKWILAQPEIQPTPAVADNFFVAELLKIGTYTEGRPHTISERVVEHSPEVGAALVRAWDAHRVTMLRLSLEHGFWDAAKWATEASSDMGKEIYEPLDDSYAASLRFMVRTCAW